MLLLLTAKTINFVIMIHWSSVQHVGYFIFEFTYSFQLVMITLSLICVRHEITVSLLNTFVLGLI